MAQSFRRRCALTLLAFSCLPSALLAQGTAFRSDLGAPLDPAPGGFPRYREDTGWSASGFDQSKWAIEYGSELNASAPWTAVLQGGRTSAGLTAAANKLTLDLGGFTYSVTPYLATNPIRAVGGQVTIVDRFSTGAYLKVANGTFHNDGSASAYRTVIGSEGRAGRLFVEDATFLTRVAVLGGPGSQGFLTIENGGQFHASNRIDVGVDGYGMIDLRGANAAVTAPELVLGGAGSGAVVLSHSTALLQTSSANGPGTLDISNAIGSGPGLRVDAGTVRVGGDLRLSANTSDRFGSVVINGGSVEVAGSVLMGTNRSDAPETSGGKIYLNGGRFEVSGPVAFAPSLARQFYWNAGTLAFSGANISLSETQLRNYTHQGAAFYAGDRAAGKIATGQTLESEGTLTFDSGVIGLAGGTIKAANGLVVNSSVEGYGTIDAVVTGTGAIMGTGYQPLAIGALGGANAVTSTGGELRIGHLGVDAIQTGHVEAHGRIAKVGTGTQTFKGNVQANDGVQVEAGRLAFDGATLTTSPFRVSAGASARFQNGATGHVGHVTIEGGTTPAHAGRLELNGASTHLTAEIVTNAGWLELMNDGTLTVGSLENPGQIINTGYLINGGTLNATIVGTGWVTGGGTFNGGMTVGGGSTLAPGDSPGTTAISDLTFGPGGSFELEIANAFGTAGTDWDLAAVGDLLTVAATSVDPFTIVLKSLTGTFAPGILAGFDPAQSFSWKFASIADPSKLTGFDSSKFAFDLTAFTAHNTLTEGTFKVAAATDGLYATFTPAAPPPAAVPEPNSMVLLGLGGAVAAWTARRRRAGRRLPANRL